MSRKFVNFDLELSRYEESPSGDVTFLVRASHTPREQVQKENEADRVSIAGGFRAVLDNFVQRWRMDDENQLARASRSMGDWLLPPKSTALNYFQRSLDALSDDESLFLRLRCGDSKLARVPWEFATVDLGQQDDGQFHVNRVLVAHPRVCVVRYEELGASIQRPQRARGGVRMLLVTAQPKDSPELALALERTRIEDALKHCELAPHVEWLDHASTADLQTLLMHSRIDVFQFSGHGGSGQGGVLELEDGQGREADLTAGELGMLLAQKGVSVVVLAACATAEIELEFPWSSVARALVEVGIPAVIGMQLRIADKSALAFLSMFYSALAAGLPIGDALIEGRKAICLDPECRRDFGVPVLYLRREENWDTVLFPTEPVPAHLDEASLEEEIRAAHGYKRVHDKLHQARISAFSTLVEFSGHFPPELPRDRRLLQRCKGELEASAEKIRSIAAEGRCPPEQIEPVIQLFNEGLADLTKALADWDRDAFGDAIVTFQSLFGREMAKLDACVLERINHLPESDRIAAVFGGDSLRATELAHMIVEIRQLSVRHHACQLLQDLLDQLQGGGEVDAHRILRKWKKVTENLSALLIGIAQPDAKSLTQRSESLRATLDTSDTDGIAEAYQEFRSAVDLSFFKINTDLEKLLGGDPRSCGASATGFGGE